MTFGVTSTGFVRKTQQDIIAELEADQKAEIGPLWDTSAEQIPGQMNGIFSRQLAIVWEHLETVYHANDPDAVEDRPQDMLYKLTGSLRREASKSVVTLACNLDEDTILLAGEHFAAIDGKEDVRWTPVEDYTSPADGSHDLLFEAENAGAVPGPAGTITIRSTPVVGWNSVTNALDAEIGREADTNEVFRQRREADLARSGSTTTRAIKAALSDEEAFPDIETVEVFENDTDYEDGDGRPPHTVEALIFDGDPPAADNDEIAQAIWDAKGGGIASYGEESGEAVIDDEGTTKTVNFSRPTTKLVYLAFTLTTGSGYAGASAHKEYIAERANAAHEQGGDVYQAIVQSIALGRDPDEPFTGVTNVTLAKLGFSNPATAEDDLTIGAREIARFDTTRITINGS